MKRKLSTLFILLFISFTPPLWADTGQPAPNFDLPLLTGNHQLFQLSNYRGRVVLVDFWASWCGPCRQSFPAYEKLYKEIRTKLGKNKFEILAVNVDMDKKAALAFLKKVPVSYPVLNENTGGSTQQNYQLMAMPTSFLIDKAGIIRVQHIGFTQPYADLLKKAIEELINAHAKTDRPFSMF